MRCTSLFPWALAGALSLACSSGTGGVRADPKGSFKGGSTTFSLTADGSFRIEHAASANEPRSYVVTGAYTYTLEFSDAENETSYGHIDLTVGTILLDGSPASGLDVTSFYPGDDVLPGSVLPGWWWWGALVTGGDKMQLRLSVPKTKYRTEDPFRGSDWLIGGNPI
jgi:hypothetical protein